MSDPYIGRYYRTKQGFIYRVTSAHVNGISYFVQGQFGVNANYRVGGKYLRRVFNREENASELFCHNCPECDELVTSTDDYLCWQCRLRMDGHEF